LSRSSLTGSTAPIPCFRRQYHHGAISRAGDNTRERGPTRRRVANVRDRRSRQALRDLGRDFGLTCVWCELLFDQSPPSLVTTPVASALAPRSVQPKALALSRPSDRMVKSEYPGRAGGVVGPAPWRTFSSARWSAGDEPPQALDH